MSNETVSTSASRLRLNRPKTWAATVAIGFLAASGATVASAAPTATTPAHTLNVSSTTVAIGDVITVSNAPDDASRCTTGMVYVGIEGMAGGGPARGVTPDSNGNWSTTFTVPDPADYSNAWVGGPYDTFADCWDANSETVFTYESVHILVGSPTTTTTTPASTAPPTTPGSTTAPTTEPAVRTTQSSVMAGAPITISGDRFAPDAALNIELHSTPVKLGTIRSDSNGAFTTTVIIPASTPPGIHHIVVSGMGIDGAIRTITTAITVAAPAAPPAKAVTAQPTFTG